MTLERLFGAVGLGSAGEPLRLGLGARHDRRAHMRLQLHVDVHQAELVAVAAGPAGGVLALRQTPVLFGLELGLARLVPEYVEGLFLGHLQQLASGAGSRRFGPADLGRLVE